MLVLYSINNTVPAAWYTKTVYFKYFTYQTNLLSQLPGWEIHLCP